MEKACIVATAKNEGPFLIEWLSHHLALGFDKIFVGTNDCDDGTVEILKAVGEIFPVHLIDNQSPLDRETIQSSAVKRCLRHPEMKDQDWALHIDLDEFLWIEDHPLKVGAFLESFSDFDILVLCWKIFGDSGFNFWHGGSILDTFLMASDSPLKGAGTKSFFRPSKFSGSHAHMPKDLQVPIEDIRAATTESFELDTSPLTVNWMTTMRVPQEHQTWSGACINHYMHRSRDLATTTRVLRGDANGRTRAHKRRLPGHKLYNEYNLNLVEDRSIRSSHFDRQRIMNAIMDRTHIRQLHYDSIEHHFKMIVSAINSGK